MSRTLVPFGPELAIHRSKLANGLELLVLPDTSAALVSYATWYRVGSRDETPGKTGQAHLLEHLMFIETEQRGPGEFDRAVEAAGGESNAATWTDWTHYYENLPASELELAVELESDRMASLRLSPGKVTSEIEVVSSERRDAVDDDVDGKATEVLYATAFGREHPYGWPTIGWSRDIASFTPRDCASFYRRHYSPASATVIVAGAVDPREVERLVVARYGSIEGRPPRRRAIAATAQRRARQKTLRLPTDTTKLLIGWHAPAFGSRSHAAASLLSQILAGGRSARLEQTLVHETERATDVRVSLAPFEHDSLFDLYVALRDGVSLAAVEADVERELERLRRDLVEIRELEKVKARAELAFLGALETIPGKAEQIGFGEIVAGDPAHAWRRLEELRSITREELRDVANAILVPRRSSTVRVIPRGNA